MKKHIFTLAAMAALALPAFSRPATPELLRHTNPDGSVVEYYLNGDEKFHYLTDASRSTILELKNDALTPMIRNGQKLILNNANIQLLKSETPEQQPIVSVSAGKQNRMAALNTSGRTTYPTKGNIRGCVILLEYPDTPFSMDDPVDQFSRLCNEKGYSDFGSQGSAKDYFEACSFGQFSPTFDVYGPVKLKHEAKWYVGADDETLHGYLHNARFGAAIQEALLELDETVDFSVYDYDNDNIIDNIFFFYSGYGQADTNDVFTVWPHQSDYLAYTNIYSDTIGLERLYVDGKEMRTYACSCELNGSKAIPANKRPYVDGIGAFCHEYGHVLGLPDLYDVLHSGTKEPGKYSVMDSGSYNALSTCPPLYSAYERWVCNWLEYEELTEPQEVTLYAQSHENANAARIRQNRPPNRYWPEYYIFECRNNEGWDKTLPSHGMLIWRINYDAAAWKDNRVNVNGNPHVELIAPAARAEFGWPGEETPVTYITSSTGQLYSTSLKKPLDVTISNITYDYDDDEAYKVTFGYNLFNVNNLATVLHSEPTADHENRIFTLAWNEVSEATDYQLTVSRRSGNTDYPVDGLTETSVGNVTSHSVKVPTDAQWKQTYTATVRVVAGLPSTKVSNKITFVPANLKDSGVDGIEGEQLMIYGGKGEIIAPEGSRVFTLSGVETGLQNLPAGIYIVVTPRVTAKVIVR